MQQFESVRSRARSMSPRSQWVQLGLLSASVVAPLISRWNNLRALEYTQSLRDEAEQRIKQMRALPKRQGSEVLEQVLDLLRRTSDRTADHLAVPLPRSRTSVSTRLWVIGATVGLAAAGAGTFIFVRRRLAQSNDEPLVDLPLHTYDGNASDGNASANGHNSTNGTNSNGRSSNAASALNGTAQSASAHATYSTNASTPATNPRAQQSPLASDTASATPTAQSVGTAGNAAGRSEAEAATTPSESAAGATGVGDAESAPFIGNIRTMVFHEANADNLPAEDNRIYFASEAEARTAGYRRDRDELTTAEAEAQASE